MVKSFFVILSFINVFACKTIDSKLKILNGEIASESEHPAAKMILESTVRITVPGSNSICTATLISPTIVISAAHCFIQKDGGGPLAEKFDIALGDSSQNVDFTRNILVHEEYYHPSIFSPDGYVKNDVAIVRLNQSFERDSYPSLLRENAEIKSLKYSKEEVSSGGNLVLTAGFGQTSSDEPPSALLKMTEMEVYYVDPIGKRIFLSDETSAPCWGDSGGPNFIYSNQSLILLGPLSQGTCDIKWPMEIDKSTQSIAVHGAIIPDLRLYFDWLKSQLSSEEFRQLNFVDNFGSSYAGERLDVPRVLGVAKYISDMVATELASPFPLPRKDQREENKKEELEEIEVVDKRGDTTSTCERLCHYPEDYQNPCEQGCVGEGEGCDNFTIRCVKR